jgi:hypothetical protein
MAATTHGDGHVADDVLDDAHTHAAAAALLSYDTTATFGASDDIASTRGKYARLMCNI